MQHFTEIKSALEAFRTLFVKKYADLKLIEQHRPFLYLVNNKRTEDITPEEAFRVYNIIKPFADKLKWVGFDFNSIPKITLDAPKQTTQPAVINQVHTSEIEPPAKKYSNDKIIGYNGNDFVIRFAYSEQIYLSVKAILGAKYNAQNKLWNVPITSAEQVKSLGYRFGFDVGDEAHRMMTNVQDNLQQSYSAEYVELNLPVKMNFYPYQTVGVDYARKNKRVIIGDQMGLGKTVQAIGGVLATNTFPALIISPKSLRLNWKDEWERWTNKRVMVLSHKNIGKMKALIEANMIDVVITNYNGIESFFVEEIKEVYIEEGKRKGSSYKRVYTNGLEKLFKSVVLDEAHNCRHKNTIRFKTISKCFEDKDVRICLTGTPIVKGPQDLAALLELIGRIDEFGGSYKFIKEYKEMNKQFLEIMGKNTQDLSPKERAMKQRLTQLNIRLRSLCFIRREKHQVLKDLPEKYRKVIRVPLDNQADYDHALFSLQSYLGQTGASEEKISQAMRAEVLVQFGLLKQLSSKGKLYAVKDFVEEVVEGGEKVVLVCWFNETVQALCDYFAAYNPVTICGVLNGKPTKDEDIDRNKKMFQTDPNCKLMIITYGKGGEGHTLTAASKIGIVEQGWTEKDRAQAEDRAHRIGQKQSVGCYSFLGEGTIDEDIFNLIENRGKLEKETTGGTEQINTTFDALIKKLKK